MNSADYRAYVRGSKCAGCPRWGRCDVKDKIDATDIKAAMEQVAKAVKAADIKAANAKRRAGQIAEAVKAAGSERRLGMKATILCLLGLHKRERTTFRAGPYSIDAYVCTRCGRVWWI